MNFGFNDIRVTSSLCATLPLETTVIPWSNGVVFLSLPGQEVEVCDNLIKMQNQNNLHFNFTQGDYVHNNLKFTMNFEKSVNKTGKKKLLVNTEGNAHK